MTLETQFHSTFFLFQYQRPILSSASNTMMQLDCESQRRVFTTTEMSNGPHQSRAQPALPPSAPSQVCTHSHAPGKGWHHETQCKANSAATWKTLSPQELSCVPHQNQPCCDSWLSHRREPSWPLGHCGWPPLSAAFLLQGIRADSPQEYHSRTQLSVHEWGFKAGIPKWWCWLCKPFLPRIFVSECGLTPFQTYLPGIPGKGLCCCDMPGKSHICSR